MTSWKKNPETWGDCKPTYFAYYFSEHCSAWILSALTVERCLLIWWPFAAKYLCTVRNARIVCAIICVLFAIYDFQWLFIIKRSGLSCIYVDGVSTVYLFVHFDHIDAALYSYVPFTVMITANLGIIVKILLAKKNEKKVGPAGGTVYAPQGTTLSKNVKRTTLMLLSVSLIFCALTMPVSVYYAVADSVPPVTGAVLKNLGYLNHGINFFLYCLTGSKFRTEFLKRIPCCRRKMLTGAVSTSYTSGSVT